MSDSFPVGSGGSDNSFPRRNPPENKETSGSDLLLFRRYRVQRELGRGGMGIVLLAHDTALDIQVAIKMMPDVVIKDSESVADLRKEVLRGMALAHPGIVRTHNFETDEGGAGIIMEYVDGDNLSDAKLRQPSKCFDPEQILPWIEQLCSALDYAHREARIVHRDLKPRNLMLTRSGRLKIADFGTAAIISDSVSRNSMAGNVSGTLSYMSPQQAEGRRPTHFDDIHAVGATIYELLTGKPPFFRGSPLLIQTQVITTVPPSIQERREELEVSGHVAVSNAWEETIAACLAKDPSERPQSAMEIYSRLKAAPSAARAFPVETVTKPIVPNVVPPQLPPPAIATKVPEMEVPTLVTPIKRRGAKPLVFVALLLIAAVSAAVWWFGRDKEIGVGGKRVSTGASGDIHSSEANRDRATTRLGIPARVTFTRGKSISEFGVTRSMHGWVCRGYLDGNGKIDPRPLDPQWKYITPFYGKLLNVEKDGKWGIIDESGSIVHEPQWDGEVILFNPGLFNISSEFGYTRQGGKYGIIDKFGRVISQPQWEYTYGFTEGLAAVSQLGKWGFIDTTGKVAIEPKWPSVGLFSGGLAVVERDGKFGYIDKTGTVVIPIEWDFACPFSEQLCCVKRGEKTGYINKVGQTVIPLQFDQAGVFKEGLGAIKRGQKWGYIDGTGFDRIRVQFDNAQPFVGGSACVEINGKWGMIDQTGRFIVKPQYDSMDREIGGGSTFVFAGKRGAISGTGKEILSAEWDTIWHGSNPGNDLPVGYLAAARRLTATSTLMRIVDLQGRRIWEGNVPTTDETAPRTQRVPGDFKTIAEALAQAVPGDEIEVAPGTYNESLQFVSGVRLTGAGMGKTIIRSSATQNAVFVNNCTAGLISDLTLEHVGSNSAELRQSPLVLRKSKVEILRCQMRNSAGHGVLCDYGDQSTLTACIMTGSAWDGISVSGAETAPIVRENQIIGNKNNGITFWDGAGGLVSGNTIEANENSGVRSLGLKTHPELRSNTCRGNKDAGIFFYEGSGGLVDANTCATNGSAGISVKNSTTHPVLRSNICRENEHNGIEFYDGANGVADSNTCERNRWAGITVQDKGTAAAVTNNRCNDNQNAGVAVDKQSAPAAFSGNTATGNKVSPQINQAATFK
jgi:parallel beta-helix repeat protein